ncbi:MAG: NADH:flavin oxidoreductase [Spirochaetae bacterium HGW-Spirochaetae-1]|jgi:2,4-dienoyl-CoA reductase-like NADH-dependent reductase (Old Yellow Enzyme family)|nr:MAG: NADH:flavin oxidoreductase [Spirochaetae bacterium HGW-Spirochaetae-1]
MMTKNLDKLFSPISINGMTLKNRAVMPAMGTGYGNTDSTVSDRLITYLERRAAGGVGLIITEVFAVDRRGKGFPAEVGIWDDSFIPGLTRLTEAVHRKGALIAAQLHHAGRETAEGIVGAKPEAPSPLPSIILRQPCEEMTIERINKVTQAFADAALRAKNAGFDAVEIHGAHGYLVCQFLSPFSNHRTDQYGGSPENRARFALEILEKTRKAVGPDFPIIIRISSDEAVKGGHDLEFSRWLAPKLVEAGADAIHVSLGVYSTPGNLTIASMDVEPGFNLFRARAIKEVVSVPVIGVGRIHDPRLAEDALSRGDADLISFGRQHLTDPDFLNKAKAGNYDDIRFCIACNQGCIERLMFEFKSATCVFNPECGEEYRMDLGPAEKPRTVWIAGAGPAGLSAAMYAAEKGHGVRIFESGTEPGGQLISASMPPHKEGLRQWLAWALRRLAAKGITPEYNTALTPDEAAKEKPDLVICATGAAPLVPPIPGIDTAIVIDARDVLTGIKSVTTDPVVILGAGYVGMETADFLIQRGMKVTVIEKAPFPPVNAITAHGYWLHRRLYKSGSLLELGTEIISIEKNLVRIKKQDGTEKSIEAVTVINALGAKSRKGLSEDLKKLGIPTADVGDSISPRRFLEAIHEGAWAGINIEKNIAGEK